MSTSWLPANWPLPAGVVAGVSMRAGGASTAPYQSLNVGMHVGDDPAAVAANRRTLLDVAHFAEPPLWLDQVHGVAVADADAPGSAGPPRADAAVTRQGRTLAIQTADCLPVLVAASDGRTFGAAHAGWRGLADGVIEALLDTLAVSADTLTAWLGPAISAPHYEIDARVMAAFVSRDDALTACFSPTRPGHFLCDLAAIATRKLTRAGVGTVHASGLCTFADATRLFSYRRDGQTGRQVSLIGRTPDAATP